ncbi:hypothetical protein ACN38_g12404, partial [Penicillium nordicum]
IRSIIWLASAYNPLESCITTCNVYTSDCQILSAGRLTMYKIGEKVVRDISAPVKSVASFFLKPGSFQG